MFPHQSGSRRKSRKTSWATSFLKLDWLLYSAKLWYKALDAQVAAKYDQLHENEVKTLVIDDKWLATLAAAVQTELNRVSQALTGRIQQLAERYATPLPTLARNVETLSDRIETHLQRMGFVW